MDEGGSRNGACLSEEAQCRRPLGRAPSRGTLEDMLKKGSEYRYLSPQGPIYIQREPGIRRGLVYRGH